MELWEHPAAGVDALVLMASRAEVEAGDVAHALASLRKLLEPESAKRLKGRLIFGIRGYDEDPRELYEIPDVRAWVNALEREFPYWFYFLDLGPRSTLAFITFALCRYEKVPGGKVIPPDELQQFLIFHFGAMNQLAARLGETQGEINDRSREISAFFFPDLRPSKSVQARNEL
jgi:hypothetical protein